MSCQNRKPSAEMIPIKSTSLERLSNSPSTRQPTSTHSAELSPFSQNPESQAETELRFLALDMGIFF